MGAVCGAAAEITAGGNGLSRPIGKGGGGFCGDEKMATFEEVYTNLYNVYLERLRGMDTFVGGKSWPSWTIKTASK